jgi:dephospho-CoA kinase
MVFYISGPHGSGKAEVAKVLIGRRFHNFELGGMALELHRKSGDKMEFEKWIRDIGKKHGNTYLVPRLLDMINEKIGSIEKKGRFGISITGSRTYEVIDAFRRELKDEWPDIIIFVDAPFELRMDRFMKREGLSSLSAEKFEKMCEFERFMGLEDIRIKADFVIMNDSGLDNLVSKTNKILKSIESRS